MEQDRKSTGLAPPAEADRSGEEEKEPLGGRDWDTMNVHYLEMGT